MSNKSWPTLHPCGTPLLHFRLADCKFFFIVIYVHHVPSKKGFPIYQSPNRITYQTHSLRHKRFNTQAKIRTCFSLQHCKTIVFLVSSECSVIAVRVTKHRRLCKNRRVLHVLDGWMTFYILMMMMKTIRRRLSFFIITPLTQRQTDLSSSLSPRPASVLFPLSHTLRKLDYRTELAFSDATRTTGRLLSFCFERWLSKSVTTITIIVVLWGKESGDATWVPTEKI